MSSELGIPDGMYEDAKRLAGRLVKPMAASYLRRRERRAILKGFTDQFVSHPDDVTALVDYFAWHEDDSDWQKGNGLLSVATVGELLHLWTNPCAFVTYEAKLLRFIAKGGETRRVFLLDSSLADPIRRWALIRTLKRHQALGFSPRVRSVLDVRPALRKLGVRCDTFGTLNGRIAYFFQFPLEGSPILVRTTEARIVRKAANCLLAFWKESEPAQEWCSRWHCELPHELQGQLEIDIAGVQALAEQIPNT